MWAPDPGEQTPCAMFLRQESNTHLCEGVSSAYSASAAEEDTELMAPVSCEALSSSDSAVCSWARASSLSCARLVASKVKDKFLTPPLLQFILDVHAKNAFCDLFTLAQGLRHTFYVTLEDSPAPPRNQTLPACTQA